MYLVNDTVLLASRS